MNYSVYQYKGDLYIKNLITETSLRVVIAPDEYRSCKVRCETTWTKVSEGLISNFTDFDSALEACRGYLYDKSYILKYPSSIG